MIKVWHDGTRQLRWIMSEELVLLDANDSISTKYGVTKEIKQLIDIVSLG